MAKVIIHMHNTPMQFWAKSINTTCYTTNQFFFFRPRTNKTSYELWTKRKSILNILGPLAMNVIY